MHYSIAMRWFIVVGLFIMPPFMTILAFIGYSRTGIWELHLLWPPSYWLWYRLDWIVKRIFPLNKQDHMRALAKIERKRKRRRKTGKP